MEGRVPARSSSCSSRSSGRGRSSSPTTSSRSRGRCGPTWSTCRAGRTGSCPRRSTSRTGSSCPCSRGPSARTGLVMNRHHLRFVLRQYIEHKNPANLRLHVWTNGDRLARAHHGAVAGPAPLRACRSSAPTWAPRSSCSRSSTGCRWTSLVAAGVARADGGVGGAAVLAVGAGPRLARGRGRAARRVRGDGAHRATSRTSITTSTPSS